MSKELETEWGSETGGRRRLAREPGPPGGQAPGPIPAAAARKGKAG